MDMSIKTGMKPLCAYCHEFYTDIMIKMYNDVYGEHRLWNYDTFYIVCEHCRKVLCIKGEIGVYECPELSVGIVTNY